MTTALVVLLTASLALNVRQAWILSIQRKASRLVGIDAAQARAERDAANAERDAALVERNTALTSHKWIVVPRDELATLAKTGCKECFGAGLVETKHDQRVCQCVRKAMTKDRKYQISDGGAPIRLATDTEAAEIDASAPKPPLRIVS